MEAGAVEVIELERVKGDGALLARATVRVGGVTLRSLRLIQGRAGMFLSAPARRTAEGRWKDYYTLDLATWAVVRDAVLRAYTQEAALWLR